MTAPGPDATSGHTVGALAEEAGQLLDVVAARLAALRPETSPQQDVPPAAADEQRTDEHQRAATCLGWCPICRSAELLKGDRPEVTQKFIDAALLVVSTLRSLIPPPAAEQPAESGDPDGSPAIQRIDIR